MTGGRKNWLFLQKKAATRTRRDNDDEG